MVLSKLNGLFGCSQFSGSRGRSLPGAPGEGDQACMVTQRNYSTELVRASRPVLMELRHLLGEYCATTSLAMGMVVDHIRLDLKGRVM